MPPVNRNKPKRAASSESQYSLVEFMRQYPDDAACLEKLWRNRCSPDGEHAYCPKCERERCFKRYETEQQRQSWTCTVCGHHLHPTAGTIFEKSSTSLHLWFYAMYLMSSTRCGISAKQLERELGVTYKTAWRIAKLIRQVLMNLHKISIPHPVKGGFQQISVEKFVGIPLFSIEHRARLFLEHPQSDKNVRGAEGRRA